MKYLRTKSVIPIAQIKEVKAVDVGLCKHRGEVGEKTAAMRHETSVLYRLRFDHG